MSEQKEVPVLTADMAAKIETDLVTQEQANHPYASVSHPALAALREGRTVCVPVITLTELHARLEEPVYILNNVAVWSFDDILAALNRLAPGLVKS